MIDHPIRAALALVAVIVAIVLIVIVVNPVAQWLYPTLERSGFSRIVAYRVFCRLLLAAIAGTMVLVCWVFGWGF
jgi:hypothetical protein